MHRPKKITLNDDRDCSIHALIPGLKDRLSAWRSAIQP